MRRRRYIGQFAAIPVSPPPPPPSNFGQFLFNAATQSGLLVLLEDI